MSLALCSARCIPSFTYGIATQLYSLWKPYQSGAQWGGVKQGGTLDQRLSAKSTRQFSRVIRRSQQLPAL